jgi:zinc protease
MTPESRSKPPSPLDPISFDVPTPYQTSLDNGLRIILIEHDRLPLVSYRLAFMSGEASEPVEMSGLAAATAAQLSEGTEEYTSLQLAEKIERLGASLNASSSDDFTIISGSSLSLYASDLLHLMAEVVLRPTFPESELDLYRRNTIENLKFQRSQPGFLANEQAARLIYGDHPYSRFAPKAADIDKLEREALVSHHAAAFIPNNALLVVVGDIRRDELVAEIKELYGGWEKGIVRSKEFVAPPERRSRSLTIVDRPGSAQSNLVITNIGVDRSDPDYFPIIVMNQVLGAGASSRVFMNLREEKGYTYGAYTRLNFKKLAGDFEATAEVRTAVTGDSLKEFFYEFDRIRTERVGENELEDAKSFLTGVFPIRAETQEGLTNLILNQYLYELPEDYLETYRGKVDAVTADDVLRVAQKHVRPEEMAIVIVGDAEQVVTQAGKYADTSELFDAEGVEQDIAQIEMVKMDEMADVNGIWSLKLDFQGQEMPVSLTLEQDGSVVLGNLTTSIGKGSISGGHVAGNRLTAIAKAEMMGQAIDFEILGKIDGDTISGTISAPIVAEPLPFVGSRS